MDTAPFVLVRAELWGDLDITAESVQRTPVVDDDEDCICPTVTQAPLTCSLGRALNLLVRFRTGAQSRLFSPSQFQSCVSSADCLPSS